jgi:hypothetical protein
MSATPARSLLGPEAVRFRDRLMAALEARGRDTVGYKDEDTIDARCPVCDGILIVHFHGTAPRADLECYDHGCSEPEVAAALARLVPRRAA